MLLKALVGFKLLLTQPSICFAGKKHADLRPLEVRLLHELQLRLSESDTEILKSQLEEVNLIERVNAPKTVVAFNVIKGLTYSLERANKFNSGQDEYVLHKLDFKLFDKKYRAIFYVVYGNFFSIEFTADMSSLLDESEVQIL